MATVHYKVLRYDEGDVRVHRMLAARALGRPLPKGVVVHHVDGAITSETPRLVICQDQRYHMLLHARERVLRAGGDPDTQKICWDCRTLKSRADFYAEAPGKRSRTQDGLMGCCKSCHRAAVAARTRRVSSG